MRIKSTTNKTVRIEYNQISLYIDLLSKQGTRISQNITKHIQNDIWELRPGNNRILYFYYLNNTFILLHYFRKKTQKTPTREIERAIAEKNDYISRKKEDKNL